MRKLIPFVILIALLGLFAYVGSRILGIDLISIINRSDHNRYYDTSFNYSFEQLDSKIKPILDSYSATYNYAVNSGKWPYKRYYNLEDFNLLLLIHDNENNNIEAAYLVIPPRKSLTDDYEMVPNITQSATSPRFVHLLDKKLIKNLFKSIRDESSFGVFNANSDKYLYFIIDKNFFNRELTKFSINQEVGFFTHEGFHLLPQAKFKRPNSKYGSMRFDLPPDYPVDETSFSLIAAGVKLYEDVLFEDKPNLKQYAKMYYVLFKKLREQDHSKKDYIDGFYLFETWLEGSAEFVENKLNLGSGVFDTKDRIIRYSNSYQRFLDGIDDLIDNGPSSSNINGVEKLVKYTELIDSSYYKLGAGSLFVLDGLGVDVMSQLEKGLNPYQMLEKYIHDNKLSIDEPAIYSDIKSQINWEESLTRMKDYIGLFE